MTACCLTQLGPGASGQHEGQQQHTSCGAGGSRLRQAWQQQKLSQPAQCRGGQNRTSSGLSSRLVARKREPMQCHIYVMRNQHWLHSACTTGAAPHLAAGSGDRRGPRIQTLQKLCALQRGGLRASQQSAAAERQ